MEQIPQTFANTQETETILAPVIQSGIEALKVKNDLFEILFIYKEENREQIVRVKFIYFRQHYQ